MSLLSDLVGLLGVHHQNPQGNQRGSGAVIPHNVNPQQRSVPNLQPTGPAVQGGPSGDESPQPITGGDFTRQFSAGPESSLSPGLMALLRGFSNPQMGGGQDLQGQTNPGFIPLQNSGFGGPGYTANAQPTANPSSSPLLSLLNLHR